jgi:translation initiation factor RLI1
MQSVDFFVAAEKYFAQMVENLQSVVTKEKYLDILEQNLSEEARELARLLLQGHIDSRGCGDVGATVTSMEKVKLRKIRKIPRSQILFGNAFFDALHHTNYSSFPNSIWECLL